MTVNQTDFEEALIQAVASIEKTLVPETPRLWYEPAEVAALEKGFDHAMRTVLRALDLDEVTVANRIYSEAAERSSGDS